MPRAGRPVPQRRNRAGAFSGNRPLPVPQEHLNIPAPQEHRSICYDDTSDGDALDNRELRIVLAGICALLGRKIDLLGMDACLMNMVEVAYQLRESVNVIVGSEIEEPFDGWPYAEILTRLTARPRQDAAALARWIVKSYLLSYKGKDETVTQSALDVSRIGEMTAKVDALSESLLAALETDAKLIADRLASESPVLRRQLHRSGLLRQKSPEEGRRRTPGQGGRSHCRAEGREGEGHPLPREDRPAGPGNMRPVHLFPRRTGSTPLTGTSTSAETASGSRFWKGIVS